MTRQGETRQDEMSHRFVLRFGPVCSGHKPAVLTGDMKIHRLQNHSARYHHQSIKHTSELKKNFGLGHQNSHRVSLFLFSKERGLRLNLMRGISCEKILGIISFVTYWLAAISRQIKMQAAELRVCTKCDRGGIYGNGQGQGFEE